MKITRFKMNNIGRFSQFEIPFEQAIENGSNIIVLFGGNGAGKTSILQALGTALSWYVARVRTEQGSGSPILPDRIKNKQSYASIEITVSNMQNNDTATDALAVSWSLVRARVGHKTDQSSDFSALKLMTQSFREQLTHDEHLSVPIVAYYPVERVVLDIPLKIRGKHTFQQMDGYDNALTSGIDFRRYFEWFREREDAENESGVTEEFLNFVSDRLGVDSDIWHLLREKQASARDVQLTAVRSAITAFMPEFTQLRIRRKPYLHMSVKKSDEVLDVAQLSQGEKSLMALVGDIARRLAMLNPALTNPLHGNGVVLIDEVDLHLHPTWQSSLVKRLRDTFPNVQFVLSTHSPLVLAQLREGEAYKIDQEKGCASMISAPNKTALVDTLKDVFDVDVNALKRDRISPIQQRDAKARLLELINGV